MKRFFEKNRIFELLMAVFLAIAFVRNAFEVPIPVFILLGIAVVIALLADRDSLLAFAICCAPLSTVFQYKYALIIIMALYTIRFSKKLKFNGFLGMLFALFLIWELLHATVYSGFSYIELFRSLIEILFIMFLMNDDYKDLDYGRIVRSLAISAIVVCITILVYQLRVLTINDIAIQRFGEIAVTEESEFSASLNPNVLAIICILPASCLFQLIARKESKPIDFVLLITLSLFAAMTMSIKVVVFGLLVLILVAIDQKKIRTILKWVIFAAIAVTVVVLILNAYFPNLIKVYSERFLSDDISNGRIDLFVAYSKFLVEEPWHLLFGIGIQNNITRVVSMGFELVPHNGIQELFVVWGIPGAIAFMAFLVSFFKFSGKKKGENELINYIPFIVMIVFVQLAQMITSGRYLILFALTFMSLRYTFKNSTKEKPKIEVLPENEAPMVKENDV